MQQAAKPPHAGCATMRCASLAGLEGLLARRGAALAPVDFATLYTPGARGYTDYPALVAAEAATAATA